MPDYHSHGYDNLTDAEMLSKVKKGWKSDETPCGSGSMLINSDKIRALLPNIIMANDIEEVADVGAGDLNWAQHVNWMFANYKAYDLYPRHESVIEHDITKAPLPVAADLIICRHVVNHMSIRMAADAIANMRASCDYLLITTCENQQSYWKQYDFHPFSDLPAPKCYDDCQHWWLELYECA